MEQKKNNPFQSWKCLNLLSFWTRVGFGLVKVGEVAGSVLPVGDTKRRWDYWGKQDRNRTEIVSSY